MATVNYNCTEARYRQNGGSWWSPLSGGRTPTGWNSDGSNKYETRYAFDFDAIRAKNVTDSIVSAKLYFKQTNEYNQETVYSRVTTSAYADIAAGSTGTSVVNGWAYISLSSAMCSALVNASAVYVGTYAAANATYIEIYGTGTYAVYLEIVWAPRAPAPTVPTLDSISTITADSKTFNWSDASDSSNIFTSAQLYYEMQLSIDNGANWSAAYTSTQGSSQYALNLRTALSLLAGQYYYNATCKIRVRAKTPAYEGTTYYSSWVTSAAFAIDYRIAPSAPTSLTPSDSTPYEGEAITFTVGRPATYNAYDNAGATNVLGYRVSRAGDILDLESFPVTTASAVLNYTVENLTTGTSDLTFNIYAYCYDAEGQGSPWTAQQSFTVKRFRAPSVIVTTIDREETSATVNVLVTDTGYGGVQANTQITKIEYNLAGGGWTEATLDGWDGLYNSFVVSGLDAATRYALQVRATNDAPADTALTDKTGTAYVGTILELIPASAPYKDPVTGVTGHFAKSLRIGSDPSALSPSEGSGSIQNDLDVGGALRRVGENVLTGVEPGEWTGVAVAGSSTAGTGWSVSVTANRYMRVGNMVFVTARIGITTKSGNATGNVLVTGLPVAADVVNYHLMCAEQNITFTSGYTGLLAFTADDSTTLQIYQVDKSGSAATALPITALANGSVLYVSGWYKV